MQMTDKSKERLLKVRELVLRGVSGEQTSALRRLEILCRKYGLLVADVMKWKLPRHKASSGTLMRDPHYYPDADEAVDCIYGPCWKCSIYNCDDRYLSAPRRIVR